MCSKSVRYVPLNRNSNFGHASHYKLNKVSNDQKGNDESHSVGVHLRNIGYFNKNLKRMSIILERDLLALRSDALFPNATVLKVE